MNTTIKSICALAWLIVLCMGSAYAQSSFVPQKAGNAINSIYPELNPVLSPDGNELFFVRANHPSNTFGETDTEDIWYSKRGEDGQWSEAIHVPSLNIGRYNAVWGFTPDGNSVLIHGRYNRKGDLWTKRGFSLVSRDATGKWSLPVAVPVAGFSRINRGLYTTASLSQDGELLVMSFSKRYNSKKSKLYMSRREADGSYSKPKKIAIEQAGEQISPFISADGKRLYFASNDGGNFDIMVAEPLDEGLETWSFATPLQTVNTNSWEAYFRTNASGSWAWYTSRQDKDNADLYFVKLFEENPVVVVSGRILNKEDNTPIQNLSGLKLYANDSLQTTLEVQEDGTYTVSLPLGQTYQLKPQLTHYYAETSTIAADSLLEYTETTADLYLTPWKVAEVKGKMMERGSLTVLPEASSPLVLVNGAAPDSVVIDAAKGEYRLWLPYGKSYQLQVEASGYKSFAQTLQLDKIKSYQVVTKDLFVDKVPVATVQGRLLDRKTGKQFDSGIPVQVVLNDTLKLALVDSLSTYEVMLPLGSTYILSAKAEGYYPMTEVVDLRKEERAVKVYKDLYLAPLEVGQSIRLNNVFFETGKSVLMPQSFPELDRVVAFLNENANMKIEISGHTDNKGSAALNNKLSAARAEAVAKYIISKGIEKDRLTSRGYGSTKPEGDNKTEEGRSLNRRVEFTILEIKKQG